MPFNDPPWHPMSDPIALKHIGKLGEEAAELARICARITIQGLDGVDPASGETNRENLEKEIADVLANSDLCADHFNLVISAHRIHEKKRLQRIWHADA